MAQKSTSFDIIITREDYHADLSYENLRILLSLNGSCLVSRGEERNRLKKQDYLLLNLFEEADIAMSEEGCLAIVSFPYRDMQPLLGKGVRRFRCISTEDSEAVRVEFSFQLVGLVMAWLEGLSGSLFKAQGLYYLILQSLADHFAVLETKSSADPGREGRAQEMFQYILANYRNDISITELASSFYLSRSAASRLIKSYTGENFPVFLKKMRLAAVLKDLEQTDLSMTEIAAENGFSSLSVLNRTFREAYDMTPSMYREKVRKGQRKKPEQTEQMRDREEVMALLKDVLSEPEEIIGRTPDYDMDVPVKKAVLFTAWKNRLLNIGSFSAVRSAAMQRQILFLRERLKVDMVRIWNPLLSADIMLMGEQNGAYNFTVLDEVLDFLTDNHLDVFLDLTPRRERTMASESREIHGKAAIQRFKTLDDWLRAVSALLTHLGSRYREAAGRWVFEIDFFMNEVAYYSEKYDPQMLFNKTAGLIHELIPGARVAGPGLICDYNPDRDYENIKIFLSGCSDNLDIFTSLNFPYFGKEHNIYGGGYVRNPRRHYLEQEISRVKKALTELGFRGEYWVTETGISIANRNFIQDSCYRGVDTLENMLKTRGTADAMGIFYASDLLSLYSDVSGLLSGSGGILSSGGIRKPVYYAYRFLHQLGDHLIAESDRAIATSFSNGDMRIACWNRKNLGDQYYMREENSYSPRDLKDLFENLEPCTIHFKISGLEPGKTYFIRQRILNTEKGGVLQKWIRLGGTRASGRDDFDYLNQTAVPEMIADRVACRDGTLSLSVTLEANEMRMIRIERDE